MNRRNCNCFIVLIIVISFFFAFRATANSPFLIDQVESEYQDEELTHLWASLSDIYNPNLDDYLKIENYLKYGRRPYLDNMIEYGIMTGRAFSVPLDRSTIYASRILQRLKLVGPNHELPQHEVITLGDVSLEDRTRCIILYSSYNYDSQSSKELYADKMQHIVHDLEEQGYQGHVVIRKGGYPLTDRGGLHFSHIPYSFKILFLIEASLMGYQDVLWLDVSLHPTNDLSEVFSYIEKNGIYLVVFNNGLCWDFDYAIGNIPDVTLLDCNLNVNELSVIPHAIAGIIGISFKNDTQHDFLREWYHLTSATWPAMSFYPEEFLISISAWRTNKHAAASWFEVIDARSEVPIKPKYAPKPFWFDKG